MSCTDHASALEAMQSWAFRDAVLCPYQESMTGVVFGTIIWGAVMIHLYVRTGSALLPYSLSVLLGSLVLSQTIAGSAQLVGALVVLMFGAIPVLLLRRLQTS